MQTNPGNFLRLAGLTGAGLAGFIPESLRGRANQQFNMCGYSAPKQETVRVGIIGLGNRGPGALDRMTHIEGVEIKALCDLRPEKRWKHQGTDEKK